MAGAIVVAGGGKITENTEFPILWTADKYPARLHRKIEKWPRPDVLKIIEDLQPIKHVPPEDSPLYILHHLNAVDKHRLLIAGISSVHLSPVVARLLSAAAKDTSVATGHADVQVDAQRAVDIVFPKFGRLENYPVVPGLQALANFVDVEVFNKLAPFVS